MKQAFFISAFILLSSLLNAQSKYDYMHFDKLQEVKGTEYVIVGMDDQPMKIMPARQKDFLLFINTATGETRQLDFPSGTHFLNLEQVKLDSLHINRFVLSARTIDLDQNKEINWIDPTQIFVLSTDGNIMKQVTESHFFTTNWIVNKTSGKIIVTGYYDTNNNRKHDKHDKHQIIIYDLDTLEALPLTE